MKLLETEIDFDFYDAEQMKRFDIGSEEIVKGINSLKIDKLKQSEFIDKFCTALSS